MKDAIKIEELDQEALARLVSELQQNKEDLEARRFIETGLAHFAETMRWRSEDSLDAWVERLFDQLAETMPEVLQASLYMMQQKPKEDAYLELIGAYAYDKSKAIQRVELGDGLIGQVAASRRLVYFGPETNFSTFSETSVANIKPRAIRLQPLIYNETLEGVLEVAAVRDFTAQENEMIQQLSESIAASLMTIRSQEETKRLYKEMQQNTETLVAQEEEMRQNLEEMVATQEELRRAKEELERRQQQFNRIAANVPGMLFQYMLDTHTNSHGFVYVSQRSKDLLDADEESLINQFGKEFPIPIHPDDKATFDSSFYQAIARIEEIDWQGRVRLKSGEYRWIKIDSVPSRDPEGNILWDGYLHDVTDAVKKNQELKEKNEQLAVREEEVREQMEQLKVTQEAKSRIETQLKDEGKRNTLLLEAMRDAIVIMRPDMTFDDCNPATLGLFASANREAFIGKSLLDFSPKLQPDNRDSETALKEYFANCAANEDCFFEWRLVNAKDRIIDVEAQLTAFEFQGHKQIMAVFRDVTERKMQEEELQAKNNALETAESELRDTLEYTQVLFKYSSEAMFLQEEEYFVDCNQAGCELFGCERAEQVIGKTTFDFTPKTFKNGESVETNLELMKAEHKGKRGYSIEWEIKREDGIVFDAEISVTRYEYQGKEMTQLLVRDISDRKKHQEEVFKQQSLLHAVINSMKDNIFLIDTDYNLLLANERVKKVYAEKDVELKEGLNVLELTSEQQREAYKARFERVLAGETYSEETFYIYNDFANFYEVVRFPVYDKNDEIFGIGIISRDTSPIRNTEAELIKAENLLHLVQSLLPLATKTINNLATPFDFDDQLMLMAGYEDARDKFTPEVLQERVAPAYKDSYVKFIEKLGKNPSFGSIEYELLRPGQDNTKIKEVAISHQLERKDTPTIYSVLLDQTDQAAASPASISVNPDFSSEGARLMDAWDYLVIVTDAEGSIRYFNGRAASFFGKDASFGLSASIFDYMESEHAPFVKEQIIPQLNDDKMWRGALSIKPGVNHAGLECPVRLYLLPENETGIGIGWAINQP